MAVLLFLDLLGARKAWQRGGPSAAKDAFDRFYRFVVAGARADAANIVSGAIESDSACLVCADLETALRVGGLIYRIAFRARPSRRFPFQPWIRGAIVETDGSGLRLERGLSGVFDKVRLFSYSAALANAIWLEKSGFKGMRLLVQSDLIAPSTRRAFRFKRGERRFPLLRRLRSSGYPADVQMEDFLWMLDGTEADWDVTCRVMGVRLRWAASDVEEFAQAAATQLAIHECSAIVEGSERRSEPRSRFIRRKRPRG